MKNVAPTLLPILILVSLVVSPSQASDWVTARSFYTHDAASGQRTHQHTVPPPAIVNQTASFQTSGFRHFRSTLQFGASADNYHRVEQWGPPVRPYGEWRFPFRPYSVPYDQWGAPFAGLNVGVGAGLGGFPFPVPFDPRDRNRFPDSGIDPPQDYPDHGWDFGPGFGNRRPSFPFPRPFPSDPYPSGPGLLYPVPPFADGYYPDTAEQPRMNDREFFRKPTQGRSYRDNR